MSNAFLYRMGAGFVGSVNRAEHATIEPVVIKSATPPTAFGLPCGLNAGELFPLGAGAVLADLYGFNVRAFPTSGNGVDGLGTSTPATSGVADVLRRGYIMVKLNGATAAAKNGIAYLRVGNASAGKPVGGIEAAADIAAAGAVTEGNTGNGTIGTVSATDAAVAGVHTITMLSATTFRVSDPNGAELKNGATGTAYTADGVTFTITVGGTPMVAGDSFTVTVTKHTVALTNTRFTGPADANGVTEIAYNV
jgi:hypothetical protein